ncbi:MAG: exodeoxyribonuclease VII small subunit [Verrucomicrobiae bacterium]|nr:exodeoxyribonuclease VII small subunit [Verrucomicrobiae bacterium]
MPPSPPDESDDTTTDALPSADPELTFEQAYGSLEELVREMESDEMPLSTLIEAYERGIQLHALCQKRLEEAQGRIEVIRRRANGETAIEALDESNADAESYESAGDAASSPSLKDDAELF